MDTECTSNYVWCRWVIPQQAPKHGLKIFFYQSLGWHWDTTSRQLKKGNHPPWYNAIDLELILEHDLEQDVNDMPMKRDPRIELLFEQGYHQNRLQLSAIDALLIDLRIMRF